ncbi:MAG: chemotaxis protein CheA [Gemmatimonadaceae bacterium]|nr:chemotaxis protein CheA [Gemmatimonadaceae bacterium]
MDAARYAELFRTESQEQLAEINRALLSLEQDADAAHAVTTLFRAVHTLKGMAGSMGYTALAEFTHELESLFERVRSGDLIVTPELMDAFFGAVDALEQGVERAQEGGGGVPAMVPVLEQLHELAGGRATSEYRAFQHTMEHAIPLAAAHSVDDAEGILVRVRQSSDAMLPGVRAYMAIEKVRALGTVTAVSPTPDVLQQATTPQAFALRVVTTADAATLEAAIRSAGEVAEVHVATGPGRTRPTVEVPVAVEQSTPGTRAARHVRIETERLDALTDLVGELVIARGRLVQLTAGIGDARVDEVVQTTARLVSDLQREVMTARMVPVWQVFDRFPRMVRDAARQLGKEVEFIVEGKEIELDRSLLDEIGEPVVHLLRNAIDHGLESPETRVAVGKPRTGRLTLSALRDRASVLIRVSDDGKGIDREKVLRRAHAMGFVDPSVTVFDDDALFRCIARPGFSTADQVSDLSGRGVGVDAVQARVRELGGSVELRTMPGMGTSLTLRLPSTLAIVRALLARSGAEHYALPLTHVRETVEATADAVQSMQGRPVLVLRDEVMPLLLLRDVVRQPTGEGREIVVLERGERRVALLVDELTGQQEIVVKPIDAVRDGLAIFSGATILGDGAPALILDVGSLL